MNKRPSNIAVVGILAAGALIATPAGLVERAHAIESPFVTLSDGGNAAVARAEVGEFFYQQLTDDEKLVYAQLKAQADTGLSNSQTPGVAITVPKGAKSPGERMIYAFFRDHPEYFWVAPEKLAWIRDNGATESEEILRLTIKGGGNSYFVDGFTTENLEEKRQKFDQRVKEILTNSPSDIQQKLLYFTNWLALNNTYNKFHMSAPNSSRVASAALLSDNDDATGPVCYGYATGMKVLLDRAGIDNAYIEGWAYNDKNQPGGEQHAWNAVVVNGQWYAIDPTWEDSGVPGVGARKQYFLVGSETVTQPNFKPELQKFSGNHQVTAERSPALRSHGFTVPTLSAQGLSQGLNGIERIMADGSSESIEDFEEAVKKAQPGDTLRLWKTIQLDRTIDLPNGIRLDLNGQGSATTPALSSTSGTVLRVPEGNRVEILNSGAGQSSITSKDLKPAIENGGELVVHPRVVMRAGTTIKAVSGNDAQPAAQTYLAAPGNGRTITGYQVIQPLFDGQDHAETLMKADYKAQEGDTVAALAPVVAAAPTVQWKYLLPQGNAIIDIPQNYRPALEWKLLSAPDTEGELAHYDANEPLRNGRYVYTAEGFGYHLLYAVDVTDVVEPETTPEETDNTNHEQPSGDVSAPVVPVIDPAKAGEETVRFTTPENATEATLVVADQVYRLKRSDDGQWQLISPDSSDVTPIHLTVDEGKLVVPVATLNAGQTITLTVKNDRGEASTNITVDQADDSDNNGSTQPVEPVETTDPEPTGPEPAEPENGAEAGETGDSTGALEPNDPVQPGEPSDVDSAVVPDTGDGHEGNVGGENSRPGREENAEVQPITPDEDSEDSEDTRTPDAGNETPGREERDYADDEKKSSNNEVPGDTTKPLDMNNDVVSVPRSAAQTRTLAHTGGNFETLYGAIVAIGLAGVLALVWARRTSREQ